LIQFNQQRKEKKRGRRSYLLSNLLQKDEEEEGEEREGRRFIIWRKSQGLENNLTEHFMGTIREKVITAFYLGHYYSYWLVFKEKILFVIFLLAN